MIHSWPTDQACGVGFFNGCVLQLLLKHFSINVLGNCAGCIVSHLFRKTLYTLLMLATKSSLWRDPRVFLERLLIKWQRNVCFWLTNFHILHFSSLWIVWNKYCIENPKRPGTEKAQLHNRTSPELVAGLSAAKHAAVRDQSRPMPISPRHVARTYRSQMSLTVFIVSGTKLRNVCPWALGGLCQKEHEIRSSALGPGQIGWFQINSQHPQGWKIHLWNIDKEASTNIYIYTYTSTWHWKFIHYILPNHDRPGNSVRVGVDGCQLSPSHLVGGQDVPGWKFLDVFEWIELNSRIGFSSCRELGAFGKLTRLTWFPGSKSSKPEWSRESRGWPRRSIVTLSTELLAHASPSVSAGHKAAWIHLNTGQLPCDTKAAAINITLTYTTSRQELKLVFFGQGEVEAKLDSLTLVWLTRWTSRRSVYQRVS